MNERVWGMILLVAGTSVGAGMLAMPLSTAENGLILSIVLMLWLWSVMLASALCLLEVSLSLPAGTNLISMASYTLGPCGRWLVWGLYLGLLYALNAAYMDGLMAILQAGLTQILHHTISTGYIGLGLLMVFMYVLYAGMRHMDYLNRCLMLGLILSYGVLLLGLMPAIQADALLHLDSAKLGSSLPILIVAFGFHIVIPSLRHYGQENSKTMVKALVIGSVLPLLFYIGWQIAILGVLPLSGHHGLLALLKSGQPATELAQALAGHLAQPGVTIAANWFSSFAIATSFIGVSISLFDFFADGLKWDKKNLQGLGILALTFMPPAICAVFYPNGFMYALRYGGAFVAVLLGILPATMVWRIRRMHPTGQWRAPGGRFLLLWIMLGSVSVLWFDLT